MAHARLSRLWQRPTEAGGNLDRTQSLASHPAPDASVDPAESSNDLPGPEPSPRAWLTRLAAALGALGAVVTVAVLLLTSSPEPEPAPPLPMAVHDTATTTAEPTATSGAPSRLVVSVVGKVAEPGLVTVEKGARVADALEAAGGASGGANLATINLARKLSDGEQIYVDVPVPAGMTAATAADSLDDSAARVDLNAATEAELLELPGVGEVTAQRILEWRAEHGPFANVEQLREVSGIGEQRLADLRERVTVVAAE
ncbi:helix-hairpin-helix domain-containing protein [Haloechinothrix salitolerans]|uniref:Helix-hairpin-helix domain-containing protein n=2 Tax=Haloechinothrix salitolerans TaxID=926830 RepID=A0ABW2C5U7_9PSEU